MSESKKEFLTFRLGKEEYAVEILRVQEIRGWEEPTPLPNVPPFVKGVVDLRGSVVPIIDLREKFNLDASYNATTVVVVVHVFTSLGERVVGLVVDAVSDVQQIDMDSLQPAPDVATSVENQFILGLSTLLNDLDKQGESEGSGEPTKAPKGTMVILIDIDKLASEGLIEQVASQDNMPVGNG
ncbi:chemotaxis protein CheW [Thiomicrorhabdus sp. ZW0627]|uniref:chemotaxis protein CheW n=1 Tax=Thiomicrorhabdus sp. ZW0627 TaxID=3039774 RepID=UPI0024364EC3|nr:chemotaxis protein CheW [Thiomicrorhabdus sp. ZW0627]MDG6773192.1 chemotaxis protein CheW [Thiomicrorhabdus sp. ZW0627]